MSETNTIELGRNYFSYYILLDRVLRDLKEQGSFLLIHDSLSLSRKYSFF